MKKSMLGILALVAAMSAGAVLAQSVTPVRAIRSQTMIEAEDLALGEESEPGAATVRRLAAEEAATAVGDTERR